MVEVTGFVAEGLAIDIPAGVEGKDRGVASGKAFSTVVFGNLLPAVRDHPGALWISCAVKRPWPARRERPIQTKILTTASWLIHRQ
jgi:hypothetical protein